MGRKSLSVEWINHPSLIIHIRATDKIWYGKHPYLTNRAYANKLVTIILGNPKENHNRLYVPSEFRIWSGRSDAFARMSSISIPNADVTVIIHDVN